MPKGRHAISSSSEDDDSYDDADPDFDADDSKAKKKSGAASKNLTATNGTATNGNGASKKSSSWPKDETEERPEYVTDNYSSYVPGTGVFTAVPNDEDDDDDDDDDEGGGTNKRRPITGSGVKREKSEARRGASKAKRAKGRPQQPTRSKNGTGEDYIMDLSVPFSRTEGLSFEGQRVPTDSNLCFLCRQECQDFYELTKHCERKHEGSEWNKCQCPICGKQFKSAGLKTHVDLVHLKVRNYRCDECLHFFFTRHDLIRHQNGTHRKIAYACQLCASTYNNEGGLRAHYRNAHNSRIEMSNDDFVSAKIIPLSEGGGRASGGKGGSRAGRKSGGGRGGGGSSTSAAAVAAMEAIFNSGGGSVSSSTPRGSAIRRVGRPSRGGPASRFKSGVKFKSRGSSFSNKPVVASITLSSGDEDELLEEIGDGDEDDVDDEEIDNLLRRVNGVSSKSAGNKRLKDEADEEEEDDDDDDDEDDDDKGDSFYKIRAPSIVKPSTTFSSALKPKTLNYECVSCGRRFTLRHLLEFHLTKSHGVPSEKAKEGTHWKAVHVCRDCDAQFQGEEDLEIHRQRMHGGGATAEGAVTPNGATKVVPRGKARRSRGGGGVFRGALSSSSSPASKSGAVYPLVPAPLPPPPGKSKAGPKSTKNARARDDDEDNSEEEEDNSDDSDFVA